METDLTDDGMSFVSEIRDVGVSIVKCCKQAGREPVRLGRP